MNAIETKQYVMYVRGLLVNTIYEAASEAMIKYQALTIHLKTDQPVRLIEVEPTPGGGDNEFTEVREVVRYPKS